MQTLCTKIVLQIYAANSLERGPAGRCLVTRSLVFPYLTVKVFLIPRCYFDAYSAKSFKHWDIKMFNTEILKVFNQKFQKPQVLKQR